MAVEINDTFTEASDTVLSSHTPDTGTGWTEQANDTSASNANVIAASDDLSVDTAQGSRQILYTEDTTLSGPEYDVVITLKTVDTAGTDDPVFLIARFTDTSNFYALMVRRSAEDTASYEIWSVVSGTATSLATGTTPLADGDVVTFEIRDAAKKAFKGATEICSTTDNALTSAGQSGIAWGDVVVAGQDVESEWILDDFSVDVVGGAGPIEFAAVCSTSGTCSADLLTGIPLEAEAMSSGNVSADLQTSIEMAAQTSVQGLVTADLQTAIEFEAQTLAQGLVTADLTTLIEMAAVASGTCGMDADLAVGGADFSAVVSCLGLVSADLQTAINLSASIEGSGAISADLQTAIEFAAITTGNGSISADLSTQIVLNAVAAGTGSVSADLQTVINLAAVALSQGLITADLFTDAIVAAILIDEDDAFFAFTDIGDAIFAVTDEDDAFFN